MRYLQYSKLFWHPVYKSTPIRLNYYLHITLAFFVHRRHLQTRILVVFDVLTNGRQNVSIHHLTVEGRSCKIGDAAISCSVCFSAHHVANAVFRISLARYVIGDEIVTVVVIGPMALQQTEKSLAEIAVFPRVDHRIQTGIDHGHVEEYFVERRRFGISD